MAKVRKIREFGNVDELPSGRWRVRYTINGRKGKAPFTFASKEKADEWLKQFALSHQLREWNPDAGGDESFETWARRWAIKPRKRRRKTDDGETSKKMQTTINGYISIFERHVFDLIGDVPIAHLTVDSIIAFQDAIEDKLEDKQRTNVKVQDQVSWVLSFAQRKGAIQENPYMDEEIALPDGTIKREPVEVEPQDIRRLRSKTNEHYGFIIEFTAYTGLRAGEVWALQRKSYNPLHKELTISASVSEVKGEGLVMGPPKGGLTRRIILPDWLDAKLLEHMESTGGGPDDWMFRTVRGKQIRHNNFSEDYFRPAKKAAELPVRFRFHDLRHYCAHWLISRGFSLFEIKEWLGHTSIAITDEMYGGTFRSRKKELAERMNAAYIEQEDAASRGTSVTSGLADVVDLASFESESDAR